uniref:Eukaryotic translation initiation factor 4E n=1 Tax=viral metagenome TaxID=1070528 RepID=A0A6C0KWB8_9ZZZZ
MGEAAEEEEYIFNNLWTLYFHDPYDEEWVSSSYKIQTVITTPQDWLQINLSYIDLWSKGMFFLMREDIQPLWEDPLNKNGGCFSYKVNKPDVAKYWLELGAKLMTDSITKDVAHIDKVCGVSVIPKRNYCIIRIWISNSEFNNIELYNVDIPPYTVVMYKKHGDNTDFDK